MAGARKNNTKIIKIMKPRGVYVARIKKGLPIIYDDITLASFLGVSVQVLHMIRSTKESRYTTFYLDKLTKEKVLPADRIEGRSYRQIDAPSDGIKRIQRRLVECVFDKLDKHKSNYAYMKGINIADACYANFDAGDVTVGLDIEKFFNSHRYRRVLTGIKKLTGYPYEVCRYITDLCTYRGELPQGAVSSPVLSIVLNYKMDAELETVADSLGFTYTRYADDMHFTAPHKTNAECGELIRKLYSTISKNRFTVNGKKTRILRNSSQVNACGYVVKGDATNLSYFVAELEANPIEGFKVIQKQKRVEVILESVPAILSGDLYKMDEVKDAIVRLAQHYGLGEVSYRSWYTQSIRTILGLYLTNRVKYPTHKYRKLRVEAMLYALGSLSDPVKFAGTLAYIKMVDPVTHQKLEKVVNKYEQRRHSIIANS